MEKITHYKVADKKANGNHNEPNHLIPIENILFDRGMVNKVNEVYSSIYFIHQNPYKNL